MSEAKHIFLRGRPQIIARDTVLPVVDTPKPGYLVRMRNSFGREYMRIVGDPGGTITFAAGAPTGTWGNDCRHNYSRNPPWNRDGTLCFIENPSPATGVPFGGTPKNMYLDGKTFAPLFSPSHIGYVRGEDRWHPNRLFANCKINIKSTDKSHLEWYDVVANVQKKNLTLPFNSSFAAKGTADRAGHYIVLCDVSSVAAGAVATSVTKMYVLDMLTGATGTPVDFCPGGKLGHLSDATAIAKAAELGIPFSASYGIKIGNVSIMPSGTKCMVLWSGDYVQIYDINPITLALTIHAYSAYTPPGTTGLKTKGFVYPLSHADVTRDPYNGYEDCVVGTEAGSLHGQVYTVASGGTDEVMGTVVKCRLSDGRPYTLTEAITGIEASGRHNSCISYDAEEWVGVSLYPKVGAKYAAEIIQVKMDQSALTLGSGGIRRLAHSHSNASGCYRCEEHVAPSPDGTMVMHASTWSSRCANKCGDQSTPQAYVIKVFD